MKTQYRWSALFVIVMIVQVAVVATAQAATKRTVKHLVKPKKVTHSVRSPYPTTLPWDTAALKVLRNSASFDYSNTVRNAYIRKVEKYARRNHITTITASVLDNMHE